MPCAFVKLPGGGHAIVKLAKKKARKCAFCGSPSTRLCDWPLEGADTCDKPCCDVHSRRVGTQMDHCADHWQGGK